jgi:hypothetical protein
MLFGTKSEKLAGELEQMELQLEELETSEAAEEAAEDENAEILPANRPVVIPGASRCRKICRVKS